jgi:hypothetical protein
MDSHYPFRAHHNIKLNGPVIVFAGEEIRLPWNGDVEHLVEIGALVPKEPEGLPSSRMVTYLACGQS